VTELIKEITFVSPEFPLVGGDADASLVHGHLPEQVEEIIVLSHHFCRQKEKYLHTPLGLIFPITSVQL
jgi:hypothetical protein